MRGNNCFDFFFPLCYHNIYILIIIRLFKEENMKVKSKVEQLEEKLLRIKISKNNHEQYRQQNNIEIQGLPDTVADEHLKDKVIDILGV